MCLPQTSINNVNLPNSAGGPFSQGQDRIRSADGTECAVSVAPRTKYLEIGVIGTGVGGQGADGGAYPYVGPNNFVPPTQSYSRSGGSAYARVVINLDAAAPQLDCSRLYEVEIERLKLEIEAAKLMGSVPTKPVAVK